MAYSASGSSSHNVVLAFLQELGLKVGFALVIGMALIATFNDIKLLLR